MMTILLVEDSRILRDRLRSCIGEIPNALLVAETDNEEGARGHLERHRPDVAIIDLRLNGGSGLSVIEHIKAVYAATTMIVLTNYAQEEYQAKCKALGVHYFFDKAKGNAAITNLLADMSKSKADEASHSLN